MTMGKDFWEIRSKEPDRVTILDTTLRDGEQSPGVSLTGAEKLEIAQQLARLGVDVIEAGFPASSSGELAAVQRIAETVGRGQGHAQRGGRLEPPGIAGLSRANRHDIDKTWEGVRAAKYPRIHIVLPTSDIHLKYKLEKTRGQVLQIARDMVSYARSLCDDVEFSAEDSTRTDRDYLFEVLDAVVEAGARTLNIPDTVGYAMPAEYGDLIRALCERYAARGDVVISGHCHDDLGVATANTLAAIANGARQVEVTINGIGERAGNACLLETVMALHTRKPFYGLETGIDRHEIGPTSRLVSTLTGMALQANKAITGANAFAHESGIHQDGILKNRSTYEIMEASELGLDQTGLVLGKHSGRNAFRAKLKELGFAMEDGELNRAFTRFKDMADNQKSVSEAEIRAICEMMESEREGAPL